MSATTIVTEDATIINEDAAARVGHSSFSWGAALAGAFIATAVTFFLLSLGSGVGLALTTTPRLLNGAAPSFLTMGAIYFLAAQAFGFAVGGHIAGRLIGPAVETRKEEEFRAGAHGLGVWAIAVVVTATMAAIAAFVAEGSAPGALAAFSQRAQSGAGLTPLATGYWVDTLFRPAGQTQASLAGLKYAQASSTTGTDAAPAPVPDDQGQPSGAQQQAAPQTDDESNSAVTPQNQTIAPSDTQIPAATPSGTAAPGDAGTAMPALGRNIAADKVEAGRIIDVGMAKAGDIPADDRAQLAQLVSLDTGMTIPAAQRRVDDVAARIRTDETKTAETARKLASYASLWIAFSLLFGAIVSVVAAISARWEDDRVSLFGR